MLNMSFELTPIFSTLTLYPADPTFENYIKSSRILRGTWVTSIPSFT